VSSLLAFARRQWFFLGLCVATPLGLLLPSLGKQLSAHPLALPALVATTLGVSGFLLDTSHLAQQARNGRAIAICLVSTYALAPLFAWAMAKIWQPHSDPQTQAHFLQALLVTAAQAGTLASAIAFTLMARGDGELALVLTMISNSLTVVLTPAALKLSVGAEVDFPIGAMMTRMALVVLLPVVVGQVLRRILRGTSTTTSGSGLHRALSLVPPLLVLAFVYTGFSTAADNLKQDIWVGARFLGASAGIHCLLLASIWGLSTAAQLSRPARVAVLLCGSQKTLPNGIYLSKEFFAANPYCPVALVLFHIFQLFFDTFLLPWLAGTRGAAARETS
jgi:sodium/bile acid cotransporter 7